MSWLSTRIPDRRQRAVFVGCLTVYLAFTAVAVLTSQAEDWQPFLLLAALAAIGIASEMLAIPMEGLAKVPSVSASTAPLALAMTLLGPAPTLLIASIGLLADALHRRLSALDFISNLANYSVFIVTGGLLARWAAENWSLTPEEPAFSLVILGASVLTATVSYFIDAAYSALAYRESFTGHLRAEATRASTLEGPTVLLTVGIGYMYSAVGVEALALLVIVQLTHWLLSHNLILAERRAIALHQRAEELADLHSDLERHASRLAEISRSRGRLVSQVLQAEENERRRLSEALHDHALQDLLVARQGMPPDSGGRAERARESIERAIKELRGAIFDLHPAVLEHAGLEAALREVADREAERAGFRAEIDVDPDACGRFDALLFVLGREQLRNAAKHSGATEVGVLIARNNGRVVMEVSDNGRGLDPDGRHVAIEHGHIGLASSAERVEALGGRLEIESRPGGGTRIRTTIPADSV
jgi:signal transduction histidine kinase